MFKGIKNILICLAIIFSCVNIAYAATTIPIVVDNSALDLSGLTDLISGSTINIDYTNLSSGPQNILSATGSNGIINATGISSMVIRIGESMSLGGIKYDSVRRDLDSFVGIKADAGTLDLRNVRLVLNAPTIGLYAVNGGTIIIGNNNQIIGYQRDMGQAIVAESGGQITIGNSGYITGNISSKTGGIVKATGKGSKITIGNGVKITNVGTYGLNSTNWQDADNPILGNDHYAVYAEKGGHIVIGDSVVIKSTMDKTFTVHNERQSNLVVAVDEGTLIEISSGAIMISGDSPDNYTVNDALSKWSYGITAGNKAEISVGKNLALTMGGSTSIGVLAYTGGIVTLGDGTKINLIDPKYERVIDSSFPVYDHQSSAGLYAIGQGSIIKNTGGKITISTVGEYSSAIYVAESGEVNIKGAVDITVTGRYANAVYLARKEVPNTEENKDVISKVTLGNNSVIRSVSTAIYAHRRGEVEIGDNSSIYASGPAGTIFSNQSAIVKIGNKAIITGQINDGKIGVIRAFGGNIIIGDNAQIINLSIGADDMGSAMAIVSDSITGEAGSVKVGKNSIIYTISAGGSNDAGGSHALAVGWLSMGQDSDGNPAASEATLEIGEYAQISTAGSFSHGLYVKDKTGSATIKDGSKITTYGRHSSGVKALAGGSVILGNDITILTNYSDSSFSNSHGIYAAGNATNIVVGNNLKIETLGDSAHGVSVSSDSRLEIGANATIVTSGKSAYGIYATGSSSVIEIGENSTITSQQSHGIYFFGTDVKIGKGTTITTNGNSTSAMYFSSLPNKTLSYDSVTLIGGNAIANNANGSLVITFSGTSKIMGDLAAIGGHSSFIGMSLKETSIWQGSAATGSMEITVDLNDSSGWLIVKESKVNTLDMGGFDTFIKFIPDENSFKNVIIDNLSGSGTIEMNVNLESESGKGGDTLTIGKASGSYMLRINSINGLGGASELKLINIEDATDLTNSDAITLANGTSNKIQIGAYVYELGDKGTNLAEIWLTRLILDSKVEKETGNFFVGLNEFPKAIDATLSDDLMKVKNKLWIVTSFKMQNYDKELLGTPLSQYIGIGTVGFDKKISDELSVGPFFGLGLAYQEIGEATNVFISSLTAGVYVNYHNSGFTLSGYGRIANYRADLAMYTTGLLDVIQVKLPTYGFSVSLQTSYKLFLLGSAFYLEPKAKATYSSLIKGSYDIGGMKVSYPGSNGFVTWLGARFGAEKLNSKGKPYGYYLEAGWVHDTNPSAVYSIIDLDEEDVKTLDLGANRLEAGIGFNVSPMGESSFSVEFKYAQGKGIIEPIKLQISGSVYF